MVSVARNIIAGNEYQYSFEVFKRGRSKSVPNGNCYTLKKETLKLDDAQNSNKTTDDMRFDLDM